MKSFRPRVSAFTLIEFLTTVAVLVIVMGLMVSLARYVRARSAEQLTKELLRKLDGMMGRYLSANGGRIPPVASFAPVPSGDPITLQRMARRNNAQWIQLLRRQEDLATKEFADLPLSIYDERTLRDAWGNPIVFMGGMRPEIGMAPGNRPFFFSAGPDGNFLTRDDNLYSYETPQ